jgi:hypothetical protein
MYDIETFSGSPLIDSIWYQGDYVIPKEIPIPFEKYREIDTLTPLEKALYSLSMKCSQARYSLEKCTKKSKRLIHRLQEVSYREKSYREALFNLIAQRFPEFIDPAMPIVMIRPDYMVVIGTVGVKENLC